MRIIISLSVLCALLMMLCMNVEQVYYAESNINTAKNEASLSIQRGNYSCILHITDQEFASGKVSYRDESEISYYGKLYDIVTLTKMDGKVIIKALHDEKEEGLLSDATALIESWFDNPAKNTGRHNPLTQIFTLKDFIPAARFIFFSGSTSSSSLTVTTTHLSLSPIISVIKSPPQFL